MIHLIVCIPLPDGRATMVGYPTTLTFSGHETFPFRYSWLKKGVDAVREAPGLFREDRAMTVLGVGKNMVRSIRHWCLAVGVLEEIVGDGRRPTGCFRPSTLGEALFTDDGLDPYLEDPATPWLLHWRIASNARRCTTWFWAFSYFHEPEFTREGLFSALFAWSQAYAGSEELSAVLHRDFGDADGRVIYCLPLSTEDRQRMEATLRSPLEGSAPAVVAALPTEVLDLREWCHELASLQWFWRHTPELQTDPVARHELRTRLTNAENALKAHLESLFRPGKGAASRCRWYSDAQQLELRSPRELNDYLSKLCAEVYPHTPICRNELVNRRNLSSSAAATHPLLKHINLRLPWNHRNTPDRLWRIDWFPPKDHARNERTTGIEQPPRRSVR